MNHIEKLIRRAIEKNISAKPICGNYRIDIEYVIGGVKYIIIKKDMHIATIKRIVDREITQVILSPIIDDSDIDRVFFAVKNCFNNFDTNFEN